MKLNLQIRELCELNELIITLTKESAFKDQLPLLTQANRRVVGAIERAGVRRVSASRWEINPRRGSFNRTVAFDVTQTEGAAIAEVTRRLINAGGDQARYLSPICHQAEIKLERAGIRRDDAGHWLTPGRK